MAKKIIMSWSKCKIEVGKTGDDDLLFLVGLKLFGEALLARRDDPLLQEFRPHFGALMKAIKSRNG